MTATTCPRWCSRHIVEVDDVGGSVTEIHHGTVTHGEITLCIEDSPNWPDTELPILTDAYNSVDAAGARDFAAALIEAARLYEDDRA